MLLKTNYCGKGYGEYVCVAIRQEFCCGYTPPAEGQKADHKICQYLRGRFCLNERAVDEAEKR